VFKSIEKTRQEIEKQREAFENNMNLLFTTGVLVVPVTQDTPSQPLNTCSSQLAYLEGG
jgi:hypothetical protein